VARALARPAQGLGATRLARLRRDAWRKAPSSTRGISAITRSGLALRVIDMIKMLRI
jgi:hypothetical protein